jgi:hypothetical protein
MSAPYTGDDVENKLSRSRVLLLAIDRDLDDVQADLGAADINEISDTVSAAQINLATVIGIVTELENLKLSLAVKPALPKEQAR